MHRDPPYKHIGWCDIFLNIQYNAGKCGGGGLLLMPGCLHTYMLKLFLRHFSICFCLLLTWTSCLRNPSWILKPNTLGLEVRKVWSRSRLYHKICLFFVKPILFKGNLPSLSVMRGTWQIKGLLTKHVGHVPFKTMHTSCAADKTPLSHCGNHKTQHVVIYTWGPSTEANKNHIRAGE